MFWSVFDKCWGLTTIWESNNDLSIYLEWIRGRPAAGTRWGHRPIKPGDVSSKLVGRRWVLKGHRSGRPPEIITRVLTLSFLWQWWTPEFHCGQRLWVLSNFWLNIWPRLCFCFSIKISSGCNVVVKHISLSLFQSSYLSNTCWTENW